MFSPLKPLLCRHDFYWSERHLSDRCRRCGKLKAGEPPGLHEGQRRSVAIAEPSSVGVAIEPGAGFLPLHRSELTRPSAKVLRGRAQERREHLPDSLERLVRGERPTCDEAIDTVLAVIEDAHSADPVLFGPGLAARFARLHEARSALR